MHENYYTIILINIFLSLVVSYGIGINKHIGFFYTFLLGIGFSCVLSTIVSMISAPLNEPAKPSKLDIFNALLLAGMCVGAFTCVKEILSNIDSGTMWKDVCFGVSFITAAVYIIDDSIKANRSI